MGGNALKNTYTRRHNKEEYEQKTHDIITKFFLLNNVCRIESIDAYKQKETFGDSDILYCTFDDKSIGVDTIKRMFSPTEIIRNGSVISFDYKELQVDLIHVKCDDFDYAKKYFDFNDIGNLIGKLAHQLGLKHGHTGLYLPLRDGDNKFDSICLTKQHDETLELLGLSVDRYYDGFDTLTDIFDFIASSHYYNPDIYLLENNNTISKVRDRKRETYRKFLEYGQTYTGNKYQKVADKTDFLELIFTRFPDAYQKYSESMAKLALRQAVKNKFNGKLVAELTGLTDKNLGEFMAYIRDDFNFRPENIYYFSDAKIRYNVRKMYAEFMLTKN